MIGPDVLVPGSRLSAATRLAGIVMAAGYLTGIAPGPLVSVIGALALVTFGRLLEAERPDALRNATALAVVAAALGVGALRWGTLDLSELRGVQAVLGPSILVGPVPAAVACGLAAVAALLALGVWIDDPRPVTRTGYVFAGIEAALWSLAVVTVFFDPARSSLQGAAFGQAVAQLLVWLALTAAATGVAVGVAFVESKLSGRLRWLVLTVAGSLTIAAAGFTASIL